MLSQHHSIGHLWNVEPENLLSLNEGVSISLPPERTVKTGFNLTVYGYILTRASIMKKIPVEKIKNATVAGNSFGCK